jgi:O-antigen ligase
LPVPPADRWRSDARWDALIAVVGVYILASVGRVHQLFPGMEALRPALLAGALAIAIYVADQRPERRVARVWITPTRCLAALLAWMVLSVPGALVQGTSVDLVVNNFLKTALMFIVIAGAIRGFRDVERLAACYFAAAATYAAVVVSRFELGGGDAWRLGNLYYYDANDFATFAVTAMPLGLYGLAAGRGLVARGAAAAGLLALSIAFVRTGSRGGFIALVCVALYVVVRYRAVPLAWRMTATAVVGVMLLVTATDQYWTQMGTIVSDTDYNRTDDTGRLLIWERGIDYALTYPVFGLGPANFPAAEGMLSPLAARQQLGLGVKWSAAHNSFIQVGAELGLPGLACFLAFLGTTFGLLRRAAVVPRAHHDAREPQLAQALTGSLLGFAVGAFFLSLAYHEMLYTLAALAVGLHKVTPGSPTHA